MSNEAKVREQLLEKARCTGVTMITVGVSARQILAAMKDEVHHPLLVQVVDECDDLINRLQPPEPITGDELRSMMKRPIEERSDRPFRHWPIEKQPRSHRKKQR